MIKYKDIPQNIKNKLNNNFRHMRERCYDPKDKDYRLYGAKGITICEEWLINPRRFAEWAVENGYEIGLTIERKNTSKGYCPENCTFIPNSQQPLNTSRNRFVEYNGEILHLSEVARRENVSPEAIRKRIKFGWYKEVPNPNFV